jgi:rubrerythrin
METTSILLILTILLLAAAFIGRPFFVKDARYIRKQNPAEGAAKDKLDHIHSSLLAEKERILSSIQELDFDYSLHKVPEDLYPIQRVELLQQAAGLLKELEDMGFAHETKSIINSKSPNKVSTGYDELEEMIAKRRTEKKEKSSGFCPRCGRAIQESDRFCPKCGFTIAPIN